MSNETYLIVSYFTVGIACLVLSLMTYALLRQSFRKVTETHPGGRLGLIFRRVFLFGITLPALAGFFSVSFRSCEKNNYQAIVADRAYLVAKNQEQLRISLQYLCIALLVWTVIIALVLITMRLRNERIVAFKNEEGDEKPMKENRKCDVIIGALLIALGLAGGGYFVGQTLYNSKVALNTAEVRGLAERRVKSDRAYWTIQYTVIGNEESEVSALYAKSKNDQQKIVSLLTDNGFTNEEIVLGVVDYDASEYRDKDQTLIETKYTLTGSVEIETGNVDLVSHVRSQMNELIAEGLDIRNNAPKYEFSELNAIKPEMLKEATQNARMAANEFAENAGVKVGGIRSASQGGFSITDVGETYSDHKKIDKNVRVVTSITFYLTK